MDDARERRDSKRIQELREREGRVLALEPVMKKTEARLRLLRAKKKRLEDQAKKDRVDEEIARLQLAFAKRFLAADK